MAKPNYTFQKMDDHCARAYGKDLPVSTKASIEMCNHLRHMVYDKAIKTLENVILLKEAIPFRRFNDGVGHRKGKMGPGRYPVKLATELKALLMSAKANAENKGLSDSLVIAHLLANKASTPFHQGRQRRRSMKRTHIELVLKEDETAPKKIVEKTPVKPKKTEEKTTVKKETKSESIEPTKGEEQ